MAGLRVIRESWGRYKNKNVLLSANALASKASISDRVCSASSHLPCLSTSAVSSTLMTRLEVWSSGDTGARVIVEIAWSGGHRIVVGGHKWSKAGMMIGCCLHHRGRVVEAGKVEHAEVITPSKKFCQVALGRTAIDSDNQLIGSLGWLF